MELGEFGNTARTEFGAEFGDSALIPQNRPANVGLRWRPCRIGHGPDADIGGALDEAARIAGDPPQAQPRA